MQHALKCHTAHTYVRPYSTLLYILDCPLDLSGSNFTLAASICSKEDRGKCCRYINAFVAVAISQYANVTNQLGVPPELSDICLQSVSETLILYGIPSNATIYCGLGLKIPVSYQCKGHRTILEMRQSPMFDDVVLNCKMPLSTEGSCRRCLNASILYLHRLVGADDNTTLNTCRDATFVTLTSQGDNVSTNGFASCFFGVQGLSNQQGSFDNVYFELQINKQKDKKRKPLLLL
ncbi:hypothetical protein AMTR_s00017p00219910 [Amborella trichopoda]|uniref:SPARK domain-containing protein n=1 Tax=Amborella trichopoda TaxID=13333 RepID=W1PNG0_AMBTC|nr:hypothetical protein AMTR_s00017p00219910 [Amborella trichopoda]